MNEQKKGRFNMASFCSAAHQSIWKGTQTKKQQLIN